MDFLPSLPLWSPDATAQQRREAEQWIDKTLTLVDSALPVERRLVEANSAAGGITKASRDVDLVIIGAAKEPLFHQMLLGEIPQKVARYSPASVLVVKRYEGIARSLIKDFMG